MAPHSSTLAWKIPWMEEPGRLQSMGSQSRTRLSDFTFTSYFHALEKEMATHSNVLPGESQGWGSWWAAVSGVAQSRTRLKWLSSSSSSSIYIECSTFTASSFRIWNSSTGIPSPPLALFVVMLPKAHLTSHTRMSGSRWVITPLWLSASWRSFLYSSSVYSCQLFLISSAC